MMDATTFDGISCNLAAVFTRRGIVRLLGGAAVLGAVLSSEESQARGRGHGKGRDPVGAEGRRGKKITICYQAQTRTVKKKGYQNKFPGATRGPCPAGGGQPPQPQACTRWILSGGPSQSSRISVDDDLAVYNVSQGGGYIIYEVDRTATLISPVVFDAKVGDRIGFLGIDGGGCRSLSELWLHCLATGVSRKVYAGFDGGGCGYAAGTFIEQEFVV